MYVYVIYVIYIRFFHRSLIYSTSLLVWSGKNNGRKSKKKNVTKSCMDHGYPRVKLVETKIGAILWLVQPTWYLCL